jgi:hypothetical protein
MGKVRSIQSGINIRASDEHKDIKNRRNFIIAIEK